jgi:prevent-host-death family protein
MKKLEATQARQEFADTVNQVAYGLDRIVVSRHGKDVAAIVPLVDLQLLERCQELEAKMSKRSRSRKRRKRKATPPGRAARGGRH